MVKQSLGAFAREFLSCFEPIFSWLTRRKDRRQGFRRDITAATAAIERGVDREAVVSELTAIANSILEMYRVAEFRDGKTDSHINREARMTVVDALVRLDSFAVANYRTHVVQPNRLAVMIEQDRIDRGGAPSRGPLSMVHAMARLPVARVRPAFVASA